MEIPNKKTLQSKIKVCKSDVNFGDCAHSLQLGNILLVNDLLVNEQHVFKLIKGLNSHKATGPDGMPARFVIDSADIICKP